MSSGTISSMKREARVDVVADEAAHRPAVARGQVAVVAGLHRLAHLAARCRRGRSAGAAICSLRVRGTLARARAAASASLRVGVGRPLPLDLVGGGGGLGLGAGTTEQRVLPSRGSDAGRQPIAATRGGRAVARMPYLRLGFGPRVRPTTSTRTAHDRERVCTPMSLMKRISLIFRSKANKALDKAEDPRETLDYSYQRQLELLSKVRRGVADVATSRKRVELQVNQLEQQAAKLQGQAEKAIGAGREDLAREALTRKSGLASQITSLKEQQATLQGEEEKLVLAQQRLQAKVEAFRTRKETIKATYTAAEAQTRIGEAMSGIGEEMGDVGLAIQRAEDKTAQMQARGQAIDELIASGALDDASQLNAGDDISRELDALSSGSDVEAELARLKAGAAARRRPSRPATATSSRSPEERGRRSARPARAARHDRPDPRRGPVRPRRPRARRPQRPRQPDRVGHRGRRRGDVPHRAPGPAGGRARQRHPPRPRLPRRVRPDPAAAGRDDRRGPRAAGRRRPDPWLRRPTAVATSRFIKDTGLTARMTLTMFLLGALFVGARGGADLVRRRRAAPCWSPSSRSAMAFWQWWSSDKVAMRAMRAREVTPEEAPELHGMIDRLCALADMPKPRVGIADLSVPNAFATGRSPDRAVVCVTTGILQTLDAEELEAVLAHELSHVAHRDVLVMTVASSAGIAAGLLMRFAQFGGMGARATTARLPAVLVGARRQPRGLRRQLPAAAPALALPRAERRPRRAPTSPSSRRRSPRALQKISGEAAATPQRDLRAEQRGQRPRASSRRCSGGLSGLMATHPPLQQRLEQLARIQAELSRPTG